MEIREATPEDVPAIARIHAESWLRTYSGTFSQEYLEEVAPQERLKVWRARFQEPKPDQRVLLAEIEGEIIGFICAYLDGDSESGTYIDNLHVVQGHQGMGIGRALLQAMALRSLQANPSRGMCLTVTQANREALRFYLRMGAQNTKEDLWNAPDGSEVPVFWIVWTDLQALVDLPLRSSTSLPSAMSLPQYPSA